jgi:hypothetical protein
LKSPCGEMRPGGRSLPKCSDHSCCRTTFEKGVKHNCEARYCYLCNHKRGKSAHCAEVSRVWVSHKVDVHAGRGPNLLVRCRIRAVRFVYCRQAFADNKQTVDRPDEPMISRREMTAAVNSRQLRDAFR